MTFVNDANGQTIKRDESDNSWANGDPHEIWHRFGGRQMGYVGNNGTLDTDYSTSITNRTIAPPTTHPGAFRFGRTYGGAHANFDLSNEAITSYSQGVVAGGYTVRQGDTLETIAAQSSENRPPLVKRRCIAFRIAGSGPTLRPAFYWSCGYV